MWGVCRGEKLDKSLPISHIFYISARFALVVTVNGIEAMRTKTHQSFTFILQILFIYKESFTYLSQI